MVLIAILISAAYAPAQDAKGAAGTVILGTVAGERGTSVAIPLYYESKDNAAIRSVHLDVDFISNNVKFSKAEKGIAAEMQDYDLKAEAEPLPNDDQGRSRTRIKIDVAVAEAGKALPQGLWSYLEFLIPPEAKPFAISLNPASVSAKDVSEKPAQVVAEAGKVIVSVPAEPLAGCFFFAH
ncbi:MAG: hypothetical protein HYX73_03875 [Acidobacteria bacterium]|nr:hypothetical protein [Acidobacteriota bacterium]